MLVYVIVCFNDMVGWVSKGCVWCGHNQNMQVSSRAVSLKPEELLSFTGKLTDLNAITAL